MFSDPSSYSVWMRCDIKDYSLPPFHPPERYPEFQVSALDLDSSNQVYGQVRSLLRSFGFDSDHYDTPSWNPFFTFIQPGDRVVIKPDLVYHDHPLGELGVKSMITNGSLLRPLIDYAWIALQGRGEIIICDTPLLTTQWDEVMKRSGIHEMVLFLQERGVRISLLDLRLEHMRVHEDTRLIEHIRHSGDPRGYVPIDIGSQSFLSPVINFYRRFATFRHASQAPAQHHNPVRNEYLLSKTILEADVFITVPKLKTHTKAGVALSMENMLGINGHPSWFVSYRRGTSSAGGDEFPDIGWLCFFWHRVCSFITSSQFGWRFFIQFFSLWRSCVFFLRRLFFRFSATDAFSLSFVTRGDWYGNDTLWRTILDINRIFFFTNQNGDFVRSRGRRYFTLIDGVWGGEYNGPIHHHPKHAGVLFAGFHPAYVDVVASHYMGFAYEFIPQLARAFHPMSLPLTDYPVERILVYDENDLPQPFIRWRDRSTAAFLAPFGWKGKIEHRHRYGGDETQEIPEELETKCHTFRI